MEQNVADLRWILLDQIIWVWNIKCLQHRVLKILRFKCFIYFVPKTQFLCFHILITNHLIFSNMQWNIFNFLFSFWWFSLDISFFHFQYKLDKWLTLGLVLAEMLSRTPQKLAKFSEQFVSNRALRNMEKFKDINYWMEY